jgi:hypothetical protein
VCPAPSSPARRLRQLVCACRSGALPRVLERGAHYQGYVIALHIRTRSDLAVVGDLMRSVNVLVYKPDTNQLEELARCAWQSSSPLAAESMTAAAHTGTPSRCGARRSTLYARRAGLRARARVTRDACADGRRPGVGDGRPEQPGGAQAQHDRRGRGGPQCAPLAVLAPSVAAHR